MSTATILTVFARYLAAGAPGNATGGTRIGVRLKATDGHRARVAVTPYEHAERDPFVNAVTVALERWGYSVGPAVNADRTAYASGLKLIETTNGEPSRTNPRRYAVMLGEG